jgi:hypothetical protein
VEFEPLTLAGEEVSTIRVSIRRIYDESTLHVPGKKDPLSLARSDSAGKGQRHNWSSGQFVAFLDETFTVNLSAQGRILELDTDAFYAAIAKNRVKHENEAALSSTIDPRAARMLGIKVKYGRAEAEQRIRKADAKYGSRGRRLQAYRKEAAEFGWYGLPALRRLLGNTMASLPTEPVRPGDRWKAPVTIDLEGPVQMPGTHTLKSVGDQACTIQVEARRTLDDKPASDPGGNETTGAKLEGTYRATLTVDRSTGCLLNRNAAMNLKGTLFVPGHPGADAEGNVPVTVKATVTAEPAE